MSDLIKISLIMGILSLFSCSVNKEEMLCASESELNSEKASVSAPLHFTSASDLVDAMNSARTVTTRTSTEDGFVSYLESVMSEEDYDDQPYAILSEAFGSILNSDGEVEFGGNLIKVSKFGLIYGPVSERKTICDLTGDEGLLSKCNEQVWYAPLSNSNFYKVDGYDDIFFYDTFCFLNSDNSNAIAVYSATIPDFSKTQLQCEARSSMDLFRSVMPNGQIKTDWNATFTIPKSGSQKIKFTNTRYCNDTKIYHQDYGIATDTGLKTKTMKKRKLGYWDKINGDMEAGIVNLVLIEEADFCGVGAFFINNVNFAGKNYVVVTEQSRGHSVADAMSTSKGLIEAKIKAATQVAKENGVNVEVDAVRFILDDNRAVILFPDKIVRENTKKIEMNFRVPFGGSTINGVGIMPENSGPAIGNGEYYVFNVAMYGQTTRDGEVRGTVFEYTY